MAKKMTIHQQAQKEINRLKRGITRAEKRGYTLIDFRDLELPQRVSRQKLEKLKKMKPSDIYLDPKKAFGIDFETEQVITPKMLQERLRSRAGKKAAETRKSKVPVKIPTPANRVSALRDRIANMDRQTNKKLIDLDPYKEQLLNIYDDNMLADEVAYTLYLLDAGIQAQINDLIHIAEFEPSHGDKILTAIHTLAEVLNGGQLTVMQRDALEDASQRSGWETIETV